MGAVEIVKFLLQFIFEVGSSSLSILLVALQVINKLGII
jgi:hypothetical protein